MLRGDKNFQEKFHQCGHPGWGAALGWPPSKDRRKEGDDEKLGLCPPTGLGRESHLCHLDKLLNFFWPQFPHLEHKG